MLVVLLFFNKKGGEATGTGVETPAFAGVSLFCTFCFVYDFGVAVFLLLLIYRVKKVGFVCEYSLFSMRQNEKRNVRDNDKINFDECIQTVTHV